MGKRKWLKMFKRAVLSTLIGITLFGVSLAGEIKVFFSPNGGAEREIIYLINHAHKSVDVAMFSFTNRHIANALINAYGRGVKVRVVMDDGEGRSRFSVGRYLAYYGIPVKYEKGLGGGLMHNKYAIIDDRIVITGSYNWTYSAEKRNSENLIVLFSPSTARSYERNFWKLWRVGKLGR